MCPPRRIGWSFGVFSFLVTATLVVGPASPGRGDIPTGIRIGVVRTLFRDYPESMMGMVTVPMSSLMESQTGVKGKLVLVKDALELGDKLNKNEVQLGVFHGFEFAWAQEKFSQLRPLMIAVNHQRYLCACLVTRKDNPAKRLVDLKGKTLAVPQFSREHCWLFLERHCEEQGLCSKSFFAKISRQANIEDALDEVVNGEVGGIVVDGVSLECYRKIKPGCFKRLKIIQQSEAFPAAAIVYRMGAVDQPTLDRFRAGMLTAASNPRSHQIMTLCKLTGFEVIPPDYQQALNNIRRAYPAPVLVAVNADPASQGKSP